MTVAIEPSISKHPFLRAELTSKVSYVQYQNHLPVLTRLAVHGAANQDFHHLTLRVSSALDVLAERQWHLDELPAGVELMVADCNITLNPAKLTGLTEAVRTSVTFVLEDAQGKELARLDGDIEVLAMNQWAGCDHAPALLAAFVRPNDSAVQALVERAATLMAQAAPTVQFTGTKSPPAAIWRMAEAVWACLAGERFTYALPPPSFEANGQKVRSAQQIYTHRLATCLDTTVLLAAAFEAIGLGAVTVFVRGHVFLALWLTPNRMPTPVTHDLAQLRGRVFAPRELMVMETTLALGTAPSTLRDAVQAAELSLRGLRPEDFVAAVDITACREQKIKPLSDVDSPDKAAAEAKRTAGESAMSDELPHWLTDLEACQSKDADASPADKAAGTHRDKRLSDWQTELLDLGLRNALVNLKPGQKAMPLVGLDAGKLEDALAGRRRFMLEPLPEPVAAHAGAGSALEPHQVLAREEESAARAFVRGTLYLRGSSKEVVTQLTKLYRARQELMEEGDANTLYLTIGVLRWRRGKEQKSRLAPLILIPVTLSRGSLDEKFSLVYVDSEPVRLNPTLLELLRQEFRIALPFGDEDLPRDDAGVDVGAVLRAVGQAVRDRQGWEVNAESYLCLLSFTRYLLWRDLKQNAALLARNGVVKHLLERPLEPYASQSDAVNVASLDEEVSPERVLCPLPADSSQLAAIEGALRGQDCVLIGPPGTGKSQTIANIIAQCLAVNKRVLFVSAKAAALDVVFERLQKLGLGKLCLSMHAHDGGQAQIIEQLKAAAEEKAAATDSTWPSQVTGWQKARARLRHYDAALHRPGANGLTPFAAIGMYTAARGAPKVALQWPSPADHDSETLQTLDALAQRLGLAAADVQGLADTPLNMIGEDNYSNGWERQLSAEATLAAQTSSQLLGAMAAVVAFLPVHRQSFEAAEVLAELAEDIAAQAPLLALLGPGDWETAVRALEAALQALPGLQAELAAIPEPWPEADCQTLRSAMREAAAVRELRQRLQTHYPTLARLPTEGQLALALQGEWRPFALKTAWEQAQRRWWPRSWWERRRVDRALGALRQSPAPLAQRLAELSELTELEAAARKLASFQPPPQATELWLAERTDSAPLLAALALQDRLAGMQIDDAALAPVTQGACGRSMAAALRSHAAGRAAVQRITALGEALREAGVAPELWRGTQTDCQKLLAVMTACRDLRSRLQALAAGDEALAAQLEAAVGRIATAPAGPPPAFAAASQRLWTQVAHSRAVFAAYAAALNPTQPNSLASSLAARDLTAVGQEAMALIEHLPRLRHWCTWRKLSTQAATAGLAPLAAALACGAVAGVDARSSFRAAYARWWLEAQLAEDENLDQFVASQHDQTVADFRAADTALCSQAAARIRSAYRCGQDGSQDAQPLRLSGLLKLEMKKKRKYQPMRKLLASCGETVRSLTPCFMMSPLSVARYLPVDGEMFDVVVFDEASQLKACEAIGAMGRAKQVLMVGDPKQLPPTNFFDRAELDDAEADESEQEDVDDPHVRLRLESILDLCEMAQLTQYKLRWHYRSHHEDLIAFSNERYYNGELITFCSPTRGTRAITYHHVKDAYWASGSLRHNHQEARALVADVVAKIRAGTFATAKHSVGIIAFNGAQASLIQEELDREAQNYSEIASAVGRGGSLNLFVKSLENVQGDERDVIYFSVAYAPTGPQVPIAARFGPLLKEGGERRLNVAITRAKWHMHVFCSFLSESLPQEKLRARGAQDLKAFLTYAQYGAGKDSPLSTQSVGGAESPFEESVAQALRMLGWEVVTQVGVGSFRIDLAVADPAAPGRFLAGIECDGATYHSAPTVRDRDSIRQGVLENLGWRILRLWSTDFWYDSDAAIERLHRALQSFSDVTRAGSRAAVSRAVSQVCPTYVKASASQLAAEVTMPRPHLPAKV